MSSACVLTDEEQSPVTVSVLLVMEDLFFRKLLRRQLEECGHRVLEALSVERGLQRIREDGADIVLLDTWVEHGTGLRLLETLRTDGEHEELPVLLVGGDGRHAVRARAEELGAVGSMPITDAGDVVRWVEEAL
jgi:CheY-like chemotaxis protein